MRRRTEAGGEQAAFDQWLAECNLTRRHDAAPLAAVVTAHVRETQHKKGNSVRKRRRGRETGSNGEQHRACDSHRMACKSVLAHPCLRHRLATTIFSTPMCTGIRDGAEERAGGAAVRVRDAAVGSEGAERAVVAEEE